MDAAEVGPEALGDEDLGVGNLPEQVVEMRISPEVRMSRSGSGMCAV
jgi:hypothetical protein